MRYSLVNQQNIIQNIIEWDGVSDYPLKPGMSLVPAHEFAHIGDDVTVLRRASPEVTDQERKAIRDADFKKDLKMVGLYNAELKTNPLLTFSAFLDNLEALRDNMPIDSGATPI